MLELEASDRLLQSNQSFIILLGRRRRWWRVLVVGSRVVDGLEFLNYLCWSTHNVRQIVWKNKNVILFPQRDLVRLGVRHHEQFKSNQNLIFHWCQSSCGCNSLIIVNGKVCSTKKYVLNYIGALRYNWGFFQRFFWSNGEMKKHLCHVHWHLMSISRCKEDSCIRRSTKLTLWQSANTTTYIVTYYKIEEEPK